MNSFNLAPLASFVLACALVVPSPRSG